MRRLGPVCTRTSISAPCAELTSGLWGAPVGAHVMADSILALTPQGETRILLDDAPPDASRRLMNAFYRGAATPEPMLACAGTIAPWFASVTFGGPDLCTAYIDSLRGQRIPCFRSPIAGLPMVHWFEARGRRDAP